MDRSRSLKIQEVERIEEVGLEEAHFIYVSYCIFLPNPLLYFFSVFVIISLGQVQIENGSRTQNKWVKNP